MLSSMLNDDYHKGISAMKTKRYHEPEIIVRNGRPRAVIIDFREYQELMERLEDLEDVKMLAKKRRRKLSFRKLDDFLKEYNPHV